MNVGVLSLSGVTLVRFEGVVGSVVSALPQFIPPRISRRDNRLIDNRIISLAHKDFIFNLLPFNSPNALLTPL